MSTRLVTFNWKVAGFTGAAQSFQLPWDCSLTGVLGNNAYCVVALQAEGYTDHQAPTADGVHAQQILVVQGMTGFPLDIRFQKNQILYVTPPSTNPPWAIQLAFQVDESLFE